MMLSKLRSLFLYSCLFLLCYAVPSLADTTVSGRISADTTWTLANSPYVVTSTVQVYGTSSTAVTLTIEPGVTVKFASGTGLQIGDSTNLGALVAQGTSSSRITFTRNATSGTWGSITFYDKTVDASTIVEYADIQYSTGITMTSASPTIRNSTITSMTGYISLTSSNPTFDTVTITNTSSYGIMLSSSNPVLTNVAVTTSSTYGLYLGSSSPTISGGSLTNSSSSGHGIYGSGSPIISNYTVSTVNTANYYGAYLSSSVTSSFSLTNSTISNGLYIGTTGITPTITGNTFTNVDNSPIHAGANIIAGILANNTINGMTSAGRIEVVGEVVSSDAHWTLKAAPYVVTSGTVAVYKDATTGSTLTIDPGVTVKFASGAGIQVGTSTYLGALVAQGTSSSRITFTRSATSGTWGTITFNDKTVDASTIVEYADIQYSTGITMTSASPTIRNSTITSMTGYISLTSSNPTFDTVTITNTSSYGILLSSSNPTISGGSLTNSSATGHGIYGGGSPVVSNYTVATVNAANYYGVYLNGSITSSLSIANSTISNGLYIATTGITPTITGNTFTNVDNSPIHAGANIIAGILANNTINGMTSAGRIEVVGEVVSSDAHWTLKAAPYVVTSGTVAVYKDATTGSTLTIDPGVTVKFASGAGIQVGTSTYLGALVAQGTSSSRITFTRSATSGTWGTITFNDKTVDASTIVEYADIQYSTGITMTSASPTIRNSTITSMTGYISLTSSNPTFDTVTITNTSSYGILLSSSNPTISGGSLTNSSATGHGIYGGGSPVVSNYTVATVNAANYYGVYLNGSITSSLSIANSTISNGLYIATTGITPTITGNTFTNVDNSPIHAGANIIAGILANNTINGMTSAGRIEVVGEVVSSDAHWTLKAAPYVVTSGTIAVYKDATTGSTLTIDPGVTIKFASGAALQVGYSTYKGVLVAQGTSSNRIVFTSNQTTPTAGYWAGLTFSGDAASASNIQYATIEYAGSGAGYSNANITLSSSSPTLRNCLIRNSAGSGIYLTTATNWPVVIDSEITGNKWGVYSTGSNPLITNTKIYSNTTYGVYNVSTTIDVDARDNYWGSATGPTYSGNSRGTGDKINDHIVYNPWLGQTPGTTLTITDAKVLPASLNPSGDYVTFKATISSSATWTINITDSSNTTVKTFTGAGTSINQRWYGDDNQSVTVANGIYYYVISAMDSSGNTATTPQGLVMVSNLIPIAIMDPPQDNQIFQSGITTSVTGTATDPTDFKNYTLDYGVGENPSSWTNLKTSTTAVTNGLIYTWNTASLTGTIYTLKLTVNDNAGNVAVETARIRFLSILNPAISETYISPNTDGVKDTTTISATITYPSTWTITIKNSSNTTVRTYTGTGTSISQAWDGKDGSNTVVTDGIYTYQIDAVSTEGSVAAAAKTGSIIVDATSPSAQVTTPAANAVLQESVTIIGTASDVNIDSYKVEYGPAAGSGPWTLISSATTSVTSGTLTTWITNDKTNTVLVPNGSYSLRLSVTDKAGNTSTASVPVSTDNLIISNVGISSNTINTNANETSTLFFNISSSATVTFSMVPESQGPTSTPVYQTGKICAAGACSFTWDGKNNSGVVVPDEAYLYILTASDGTRTDSYSPNAPTSTGTVTCSQSSSFDFAKNIPMTVTYTPAQPARINVSISWGNQNFKIQDAVAATANSHTYIWSGWNPNNKLLDVGAQSSCTVASLLRENHIITTGDTIIANNLKADPYVMQLSYGHFTRIKYTLPTYAYVTVKLRSPSGTIITLFDNNQLELLSAGEHIIIWNGLNTTDITEKKALLTEEGDYMITIQTVNPGTGTSSSIKGSLKLEY